MRCVCLLYDRAPGTLTIFYRSVLFIFSLFIRSRWCCLPPSKSRSVLESVRSRSIQLACAGHPRRGEKGRRRGEGREWRPWIIEWEAESDEVPCLCSRRRRLRKQHVWHDERVCAVDRHRESVLTHVDPAHAAVSMWLMML